MKLQTGNLFAEKYILISRIGEGGYGQVWRAHHKAMGRDVAIKTLRPEAAEQEEEVERFRREVFNASCLQHPNTITLHDYGKASDGTLFIVMELLSGMNLGQWLTNKGPFTHEDTFAIIEQILRALREAHQQGILHRDIKPENIFLCSIDDDAQTPFIKVLDFGLSKAISGSRRAEQRTLTKEGKVYGTPQYMSPEQACAMKLSPASDIYALGLMCWETLTGQSAFTGGTPVDILLKQVNEPTPPLPPTLQGTILDQFIQRATQKDPKKRFESAREALEWLLKARDNAQRALLAPPTYDPAHFEPATTFNVAIQKHPQPSESPAQASIEPWFSRRNISALDLKEIHRHLDQLPMMGRHEELQDLLKWGQQAMITGSTLFVLGAPGAGKTRLIQEWLKHMEMHSSVFILQGSYSPQSAPLDALYHAFLPLVEPDVEDASPTLKPHLIDPKVKQILKPLLAQKEDLAQLPHKHPTLTKIVSQLEQVLYRLAQQRPTILVLENLHDADPLTRELITHWQHTMSLRALPLVLVFSQTPSSHGTTGAHSTHNRFQHLKQNLSSYAYQVLLKPLPKHTVFELLDDLMPFEHHLKQRISDTARGNPLYLRQIIKHLFEQKLLELNTQNQWELIVPSSDQDAPSLLPHDLEELLIAHIFAQLRDHRLSSILHTILMRAIALGDRFETRLLKELLRREQREDLLAYLDDSIEFFTQNHILYTSSIDERPALEFGYDLLRLKILNLLAAHTQEDLQSLHRLIAETLHHHYAHRFPELVDIKAHVIAQHWAMADQPFEALQWKIRAARHAEHSQNFLLALKHLDEIHAQLDKSLDPNGELLLEVRLAQGRMFRFLGEFSEAEATLKEAVQEATEVGDIVGQAFTQEALASLLVLMTCYNTARETFLTAKQLYQSFNEPAGQLRCDLGISEIDRFAGNYPSAQSKFAHIQEHAVQIKSCNLEARAIFGQGQCAYAQGSLKDASDLFKRARKLAETQNDILLCSEADVELTLIQIPTRHIEHAISTINLAMELKRQIGDTLGRAHAHLVLGMCLLRTPRLDEAEQHAKRAENLNERLHHDYGMAKSLLLQSEIALMRGKTDNAMELAAKAHDIHQSIHDSHGLVLSSLQLSRCLLEAQQPKAAKKMLTSCEKRVQNNHLQHYTPIIKTLLGRALSQDQAFAEARQLHEQATLMAASRGNIEVAAIAAFNLAITCLILGDTSDALQHSQLAMTRAEYVGHTDLLLLSMTLSSLLAHIKRDSQTLSSNLRRLRVLRENAPGHNLNLPQKLKTLAQFIATHQPPERAFATSLAIVEMLRELDDPLSADQLAQNLMRRPSNG